MSGRDEAGLSPRVRGNPAGMEDNPLLLRSIPACAGEPGLALPDGLEDGVYPRVCGGTIWSMTLPPFTSGLSPRVRGNPPWIPVMLCQIGSIPACAGEPG